MIVAAMIPAILFVAVANSSGQESYRIGTFYADVDDLLIAPSPRLQSALLFRPLLAAQYEPRVGFQSQLGPKKLRLDIGYSANIWETRLGQQQAEEFPISSATIAFGVDAFTYTRLRAEANLKFPVETIDYLFGVNGSYKRVYFGQRSISMRVRLSHISAHLADGYADSSRTLRMQPFVYSREFLDALIAHEWYDPNVRIYGGGTVLLQVKQLPRSVGRIIPQLGLEWCGDHGLTLFVSYDMRLLQIDRTVQPVHSVQMGAVVLERYPTSLVLSGYYYAGLSMHGMFYDQRDEYFALGMQLLF